MADQKNVDIDGSNNSKTPEQPSDSSSVDAGGARDASYENSEQAPSSRKKHKRSIGNIILRILVIVVIVIVVVCVGGFSFYRWLWGNDPQDIQGTWYIEGTDIPVVVTEDRIILNDEISYIYEMDSESKILTYTIGDLEGSGRYRFSIDRDQVAIMDGTFNWWTTLLSDIGWTADAFVSFIGGEEKSPAGENDVTLLARTGITLSDSNTTEPSESDAQGENFEEEPTPDANPESPEGNTDEQSDAERPDDSVDRNGQNDQDIQNDQSGNDESNSEGNHEESDMFGMYDI